MFGIIIDCDRKDGFRYFIYNKEVLEEDSKTAFIIESIWQHHLEKNQNNNDCLLPDN